MKLLPMLLLVALPCWGVAAPIFESDFESSPGDGRMDKRYVSVNAAEALDGKGSLEINTLKNSGEWNVAWALPAGVLKAGHRYEVKFDVKLIETNQIPGAHLLFVVRPLSANHGNSDAGMQAFGLPGKVTPVSFSLNIPAGVDDYSLQIHSRFGVRALVDNLVINEADLQTTPVTAGIAAVALPAGLPTGATPFTVNPPKKQNQKVFNAKDFGVSTEAADNFVKFQEMIDQVRRQTPAKIVLEPGVYRLGGDKGLKFDGCNDFEFEGSGATLLFNRNGGERFLVGIMHCRNAEFRNVTIDWDWENNPLASLAVAESISADGKSAVFRLPELTKFPKAELRAADLQRLQPGTYDEDHVRSFRIPLEFYVNQNKPQVKFLSDNQIEIATKNAAFQQIAAGEHFRLRHFVYEINGITMMINQDLTLQNVNVASAPGMGMFISGAQKNWQMLNCRIAPPEGAKRLLSTTADGLHMGSSAGNFRLTKCEIAHSADDAINLHSLNGFAVKVDDYTIKAVNLNYHPGNYYQLKDVIELRNDDFSPTGFKSAITALKPGKGKELEITFAEKVPDPAMSGFVLYNQRLLTKNIIIEDNYIHDFPRGLLLAADDVTIQNNRFVNGSASGIKLETGYTFHVWSEGYGVNNAVIRNNYFERVNQRGRYPNENRPDIYINSYMGVDPSLRKTAYPVINRLWISGNTFVDSTGSPVFISTAGNVVVSDNKFINREPAKVAEAARGTIGVDHASNIAIVNNVWQSDASLNIRPGVSFAPGTVTDLTVGGNRIEPLSKGK